MGLLDTATWDGQIYSAGWRTAAGGARPVVEPATGKQLAAANVEAFTETQWVTMRSEIPAYPF
jgi:hypothetical protein